MKHLLIALFTLVLVSASQLASAKSSAIVLASCPPWKSVGDDKLAKNMEDMCALTVKDVATTLNETLGVRHSDIHILLQEDAEINKIKSVFSELKTKSGKGDVLFVYSMTHGGVLDHSYKGYPVRGEVLALYTKNRPENYSRASNDGRWLPVRIFRDMISDFSKVTGSDVVVIIEACHAASSMHEFKHNPLNRLGSANRISVIFSAAEDQTSTFTNDSTKALFTSSLLASMKKADIGDSLYDVFRAAQSTTLVTNTKKCLSYDEETKKAMFSTSSLFLENCTQEPSVYDPMLLLETIKFKNLVTN